LFSLLDQADNYAMERPVYMDANTKYRIPMAWLRLTAVFFLCAIMLAMVSCAPAGETSGTTARSDADTALVLQAAAQGGNLHYRNLVLAFGNQIIFNAADGQLSLAAADGSQCSVLWKSTGIYPAYDSTRLFYIEDGQSSALAKIGLDGSNQVRIGQSPLKYLISDGNWLYAIESDSGSAVRLKKDGSGRQVLSDAQPVALTLAGSQLFITGAVNPNGLVAIDLATDQKTVLLRDPVTSLNVADEWLYFSQPSDSYHVYAWSTQRKTLTMISHLSIDRPFIVSDHYLYFMNVLEMDRLYRLPVDGSRQLDGSEPELIIDDRVDSFVVCGDYVYYQRPASTRIYRYDIRDGTVRRIT
jgi:hypothetical protein